MLSFIDTGLDWVYQDCTTSAWFPLNVILLSLVTPLWVWMLVQYQLVACVPAAVGWATVLYWRALLRAGSAAARVTLSLVLSEGLLHRLAALPPTVADWFCDHIWEASLFGGWHGVGTEHPMGAILLRPLQRIGEWTALGYTQPLSLWGESEELTLTIAVLAFCLAFVTKWGHAYAVYREHLADEIQQAWVAPQQPESKSLCWRWWVWLKHTVRKCVSWCKLAAYLAFTTVPVFVTVFLSLGVTVALIVPIQLAEYILYLQAEAAVNGQCVFTRTFYVFSMGTTHRLTRVLSTYSTFLWGAAHRFISSVKHAVYWWAPEEHCPARCTPRRRDPELTVERMMYVEDKRRVQATETRAFTRSQARKERMLWQQQNQQAAAGAPSQ
jgi:hypothetical protein